MWVCSFAGVHVAADAAAVCVETFFGLPQAATSSADSAARQTSTIRERVGKAHNLHRSAFTSSSFLRTARGLASLLVPRDPQRPFVLPDGAVEVILARHGSVEHQPSDRPTQSDGVIGGHSDPDLTELGRRQAVALATRLRSVPARALFVTPLRRTQQTAAPLAAELGLEPRVEPDLREVYLGDWEGRSAATPTTRTWSDGCSSSAAGT